MLKHLLLLTGFVSLFTTVTARAQTGRAASGVQGQTSARVGEEPFRSGLDFGFVTGIFNYSEPGMRDSGNLNGFAAAFDRRNEAGLAGRLEGDLMFGILKYDGALNDVANQTSKPYSTQTFDAILNLRALGGYAFDAGSSTEIRPFIGGGYRVLSDNMQGEGAYQREITYYYLPVGLAVTFGTGGGWKVRATAEYDRLLSGTAKSYLTQVNLGKDVENHQSAGEACGSRSISTGRSTNDSISTSFRTTSSGTCRIRIRNSSIRDLVTLTSRRTGRSFSVSASRWASELAYLGAHAGGCGKRGA